MADSDSDSDIEWDWQPTLQEKIKEILNQYPDDAQILKEIIQNAEDADAKCVKFLYDKNSYTTEGLEDETSVGHQGEALYAYNDAVFTKADFENLLNVRKSAKQTDRSKVGRFGQGFKSIFHMTELPTLLSGMYLAKISPYLPTLPKKRHSKLNKDHPAELQSFRGEFQGYSDEVARRGHYKGTIFRFPLQKRPSEISKTLYGEEKIMDLFQVLKSRAYMNLLFLKSLERIEVYVQDLHKTKPRLLFHVCIGNSDKSMLKTREKFFRELHATGNEIVKKQCHITYKVDMQFGIGPPEDYNFLQSFLVHHYYDGRGNSSTMKKLLGDEQLSYQPLVSVAMPLNEEICDLRPEGHIFCILPLPIRDNTSPTGLPVHVSGFFVVSSNRSEIKWPTAGQNRAQMTDSLKWNNCLLTELIPKAYTQLLLDATGELSVHSDYIYHAFPNIDFVDEKWRNTFLEPFLKMVLPLPILATEGGVKRFVNVSNAVLCPPNIDEKTRRVLVQVLTDSGLNAVCPPEHISKALKSRQDIQLVAEATANCVLHVMKWSHCYRSFSRDDKLLLLSYLLGKNPVTPAALHGLELLPLADGTFATFGPATSSSIFIAESKRQRLLPTLENRFMSYDLEMNLDTKLRQQNIIGQTQLALCNDEGILSLLPSIFPRHCAGKRTIKCDWDDAELEHINGIWLENLWKFLTSICFELPEHLDRIKHLHILPIQLPSPEVIHLTKLSGGTTCIVKTLHDETLSDQLAKTLGHFDVKVLDEIPEYVRCHPLVFQRHGIYNPNPDSVIRALLEAYNRDNSVVAGSCKFNQHSTPDQRLELVQLFQPVVLSKRYGNGLKQFLEHLELFATVDGSGKKRRHFTSVAKCPTGVTGYTIPVSSPCLLLDASTTGVRQMAAYIGVNIVTETKIIEDHIFDQIRLQRLQPLEVEKMMVYVLQNLHAHIRGSKTFLRRLQELAFLTDRQGRYYRASDLFDPNDSDLQNLFHGEDRFPSHTYQQYLDSLRRIGLKDKGKVTGQDLIYTAKLIAQGTGTIKKKQKSKSNQLALKSQGMSAVLHENQNQNLFCDANTNTNLRQLAWVPVRHDRPSGFPRSLAWGCGDQKFQTPSTMCLSSEISVVGSVMPSVDTKYVSDIVVERVLGRRQLPLPRVMQHIKNIVMSYHSEEKVALMGFVQKVYEAMEHYSIHDVKECLAKMKLVNWVWHGNGFTSVDCIIPEQSEDFAPYAYSLPGELSGISSWLHKMGVRNECDWLQILQRIRRHHDGMSNVNSDMVAHDLRITVLILGKIASQSTEEDLKSQMDILLLPVRNYEGKLQLLPVEELCLNQSTPRTWLRNTVGRQNFRYVHPDIPIQVAQALGVHSDQQNVLSRLGTPLGQPFGQKEPLTTRIKSILQNYPCDEGVLKELLQNADDAGATQLRFILDKRQHKGERVFDDNWKLLQGPALCVYNNKPFTEKDLEGICSLGRGSKSSDPTKTGQYGIGFNSVYHLTDVPCFLTDGEEIGRTFGILDPNCSYAPGACMENPGRAFEGDDFETVHADFTDVFSGYLEDSLVMKGATLFRLPLRSKEMAEISKISNEVVITDFAEKLLRLFEAELFQNLLFVNSVRTISLESIGRVHEEKYSVHVEISENDNKKLHEFNKYVKRVSDDLHNGRTTLQNVEHREVIYTVRMEDSKGQVQIWSVCQCIGFRENCEIPGGVAQAAASKELALLPRGGAALLLDSSVKVKLGRQIFCFLPLPSHEDTKLPVHINGHFALDSARRTLWDDGRSCPGYKSMWNSLMMEKIVAQAYVSLLMNECNKLKRRQNVSQEDLRKFYSMFPDISKIKVNYLNELVSAFYTTAQLDKECLAVQTEMAHYAATRWFSISQCLRGEALFDNLSRKRITKYEPVPAYRTSMLTGNQQPQKRHTTTEIDHIHSLTNILRRLGFNLLSVPMFIYHSLRNMKINVHQVEPKTVLEYLYNYRGHRDCTLKQLPQPVTESPFQDIESVVVLTEYCYEDHHALTEAEKEETKSLVGLPLCVTDDEVLQEFSQTNPRFYPRFSSLVPHHSNLFVMWQVYNAIPFHIREKKPLALGELTIAKFAPLLLPEYGSLQTDYRLEWDPTNEENAFWKKWIGQIWDLINSEIDKTFEDLKGNREATLKRLEPLKQFCIVPAHDSSEAKHFLYQLKYGKCIWDEGSRSLGYMDDDSIPKLLVKAGIPRLYTLSRDFTASLRLPLPREIVSHVDNPRDILYALWNLLQHYSSAIRLEQATRTQRDALQLREYFTNLFKENCTREEATRLRNLPIHQFVNHEISSLGNCGCYLVPKGLPKAGLDNWYSKNTPEKFIFLTGTDVDQLYRTLGAVEKTTVDLYVELILKKIQFQQFLNEEEQLEHLVYLAEGVIPQLNSSSREYKALIASLQNLPFLKNPDGDLELAKGFFDPTVPLFEAMETNFPPKHFHHEGWLQFLELCGLNRTVTGEDLQGYAEEIEAEGKQNPTTETEDKAKLICKCLIDHDEAILFQLKDIEFLPIGTVPTNFSNLHRQYPQKKGEAHAAIANKFISFQDSVMYKDFEQCWTVAKVLPAWFLPIMASGNLLKALGVQNPVKLTTIVEHCIRLSRHLSRFNLRHKKPGVITDVMNKIYGQLGARAEAEGAQSHGRLREKLGEEPCVWINNRNSFVLPQQVAVALPENEQILPYLHKLPRTLLKHVDLMTAIGVKSDPDHTHYMMVLKMIKDEFGDSDLASDVNKMDAATKAIGHCLPLLYHEKKVECELPLHMLSRKKTLEVSSELYHVDQFGWENRLTKIAFPLPLLYLPEVATLQLHHLKKISEPLRPKKLSCLLEEVLDEESLVTACLSQTENTTTDWFKDHIQNEDFCFGLQRLLRHDASEQDCADSFEENWSEVMKRLMKIQFYTVNKLVTVLKYKNGDIIPGTNSEWQKIYIKTSAIGCEVYVVKHDRRGYERTSRDIGQYSKLLRIIIKKSFPKLLPQISELLEAILRTPMNDISTILDDYNITHCTSRSKIYPTLGSFIHPTKHGFLVPDFLQFFPGEYIGLERDDPMNEGRGGQATYIYAKVVLALPLDDTEMEINRQYIIDIGDCRVNVYSSSMYKLSPHVLKCSEDNIEPQTYDLEKVKHQIAADLDYAFYKLTIEERNRVLKRMVMKWQPDNHPEHRDIAATILRYIDENINKIENDANRPVARGGSGDTKWYGVDNIFAYASQRAQEQRAHIQQQRGRLAANDRARGVIDDPDDYSYLSENGLNPQPGEAKRLYRQAEMDLNASLNDTPNGDCEWALYKCHQAAEKALKAVYYMRDSEQSKHHDLRRHAEILDDPDLLALAGAIANELGDGMKLRYPDRLSFPKIPHDLYKEDTCARIYELAKRLLKRAEVHLIL